MKKFILVCLLATSAASAFAGWTRVAHTDLAIFYLDYETIRKDGIRRNVWGIQDFYARDKNGVMSIQLRYEYDCIKERNQILSAFAYSQNMADGPVLFSVSPPSDWRDIPPRSAFETILNIVCAN